jgi:hypothetical protein
MQALGVRFDLKLCALPIVNAALTIGYNKSTYRSTALTPISVHEQLSPHRSTESE